MANAFDMGDGGFEALGGVSAPKSSVVPEHGQGGDVDLFAAAALQATPTIASAAPLSNTTAGAPSSAAAAASTSSAAKTPTAGASGSADIKEPAGPTPYSIWEGKKQQQLAEKQQKANELKKAAAAAAKADVQKFMAARDERIAQRKAENRTEEKANAAATKQVMNSGSHAMFEKIGKMVDTSAKSNEKRANVDRMRKLLIQLKTNPPQHIGGGSGSAGSAGIDSKVDRA